MVGTLLALWLSSANGRPSEGTASDPDATTHQLTANAASQPKYFLRMDSDTLRLLDAERREIASQGNDTLTLTTTLPSLDPR